jgi:hypothetical protein
MLMDSISMHSNTMYMSTMDGGKQFEGAVSLNHYIITSYQLYMRSDPEPQNLSQITVKG